RLGIQLFPYDAPATFYLAEAYRQAGMCGAALPLYEWARSLDPESQGRTEYALCLLDQGRYAESKQMATKAVVAGGRVSLLHQIMADDDSGMAKARRDDSTGKAGVTQIGTRPSKLPETVQKAAGKAGGQSP